MATTSKRITDRSLPPGLVHIAPDATLFQDLVEAEKKLDWTITRKHQEINDSLNKPLPCKRTLRVFLSHEAKNQPWQRNPAEEGADGAAVNFETGEGVPSWSFKIEGKILDAEHIPKLKSSLVQKKFSQVVRSVSIEMDRDPAMYPDANHVQWNQDPRTAITHDAFGRPQGSTNGTTSAPLDGFEFTRTGDQPQRLRIGLHLIHNPERVKIHADLAALLNITEDTRANIFTAFWTYVKLNNLQDKTDRRHVKPDARLKRVLTSVGFPQVDSLPYSEIPGLLTRLMIPSDPIILNYEVKVDQESGGKGLKVFDLELEMDDVALRTKLGEVILNAGPERLRHLAKLDEDVIHAIQQVRHSKIRHDFFKSLAENPSQFIQTWLSSQSRDLEVLMGNERAAEDVEFTAGVRDVDVNNPDFFKLPWVEEAVSVYEGLRVSNALSSLQQMQLQAHQMNMGQGMR